MGQSKQRDPEKTRKNLERNERSARLLANNDFKEWRREFEYIAMREAREAMRPERSNYERAMSSGILDFIERRFGVMEKQAKPEALKKMRESLEDSKDAKPERSAGKHEPTGFAGISAIGEF